MGDQFEKYVQQNRDEFDQLEVPDQLWGKIDGQLHEKRVNWNRLWKVAALLFLISTVILVVDRFGSKPREMKSDRYREFYQAERFYTSLIEERKEEIENMLDDRLREDFRDEMLELDLMYNELKTTWEESLDDGKLVDAMIENLQMRVQILNSQLQVLKNLQERENEDDTVEM